MAIWQGLNYSESTIAKLLQHAIFSVFKPFQF